MKEVDYVKTRPYLIDDEHIEGEIVEIIEEKKADCLKSCLIDCEYIVVEEKKVVCCKAEGQKMMKQNGLEYEEIKKLMSVITKKQTEIIEEKIECCKIDEKKVELIKKLMPTTIKKYLEITEDQKVEDINMLKPLRKLNLPKKIL